MDNILTNEQLDQLRKDMPKGFRETISKKANCSTSFVRLVFRNESKDFELTEKVINEAIKLKTSIEEKKKKLREKVS